MNPVLQQLAQPTNYSAALVDQAKRLLSRKTPDKENSDADKESGVAQMLAAITELLISESKNIHLHQKRRWLDHLLSITLLCMDFLASNSSKWTIKSLELEMTISNIISRLIGVGAVTFN